MFNEDPKLTDAIQGEGGTCYIMASLASLAEFPSKIKDLFLTQEVNTAGIYGVTFYIRGKPWVVDVDDHMLFKSDSYGPPQLKMA